MMARRMTIEEELAELGYQDAKARIERLEGILGRDVLAFTGDGESLGVTYRDGDVTVVWSEGPTCVVVPAIGSPTVVRMVKTKRGVRGLVQRMCSKAHWVCQDVIDEYRASNGLQSPEEKREFGTSLTLVVNN